MDIQNMAAVKDESIGGVLGYLTWYSVSETQIKRDDLLNNLRRCGLDEGWMPPKIRIPDAFRKATKAVEKKRVPGGDSTHQNYLVREVSSDKEHVQRNIVLELVDGKGKRLDYRSDEAIIILDKKDGTITTEVSQGSLASDMVNRAIDLYNTYKDHHDARAIRSMVQNMLRGMAPTPVRPSGGVYFVLINYKNELEKLNKFLHCLPGESEGFMVPLIDNLENRDMVRKKLNDHLKDTLRSLKDGLVNPKLDKSNANILLDESKRRLKDFKMYRELLSDEMTDIQELTSLIRAQMQTMLERKF